MRDKIIAIVGVTATVAITIFCYFNLVTVGDSYVCDGDPKALGVAITIPDNAELFDKLKVSFKKNLSPLDFIKAIGDRERLYDVKITPNTESVVVKGKDVRCFTKAQYHGATYYYLVDDYTFYSDTLYKMDNNSEYKIRFPRNGVSVKDGKIESVCNIEKLEQE